MTMTLIPVLGLIIAVLVFRKKYILTDDKVRELAQEITKKRAAEQQEKAE
jgi:melibiose permease